MISKPNKTITRRQTLTGAAIISLASAAACARSETKKSIPKKDLVLNYKDPIWNRDAMARIQGNLDFSKEKIGWYKGKAFGVVPGRKNLDICGFEGFSVARLLPLENGSYRKVLREVGFYTDLKTGEVLDELKILILAKSVKPFTLRMTRSILLSSNITQSRQAMAV